MSHWIQRLACIIALAAVTGLPAAALACAIACAAPVTAARTTAEVHQHHAAPRVADEASPERPCHRAGLAGLQLRAPSHDCSSHDETAIETSSTLVASRADDGIGVVPAVLAPAFLQPARDHGLRARSDGPPLERAAGPLGPSGRLNLRI